MIRELAVDQPVLSGFPEQAVDERRDVHVAREKPYNSPA
jgi:hypothetical protein